MKLVRLITVCSDELHIVKIFVRCISSLEWSESRSCLGFWTLLFGVHYQKGPKNQERLELCGTYQLLFYADTVNLLVECLNTIKEYLEVHLGVNSQKTNYAYMFMSHYQRAGQNYNTKIMIVKMSKEEGGRRILWKITRLNYLGKAVIN